MGDVEGVLGCSQCDMIKMNMEACRVGIASLKAIMA